MAARLFQCHDSRDKELHYPLVLPLKTSGVKNMTSNVSNGSDLRGL